MKSNKENASILIGDLCKLAESEDARFKFELVKRGKSEKSIGDSFWVYHLHLLRDLIAKLEDKPEA